MNVAGEVINLVRPQFSNELGRGSGIGQIELMQLAAIVCYMDFLSSVSAMQFSQFPGGGS